MWNRLFKDEKGFTGLEAAIVLVAFVVVAAVFSYVMLGAGFYTTPKSQEVVHTGGFYTTQKSQEVVHTGVQQANSSVELSEDVIAKGDDDIISEVNLCLQLTSGGSSVDMAKTLIVFSSPAVPPTELTLANNGFTIPHTYNDNEDNIIDRGEKFEISIDTGDYSIGANDEFQLEIKPPQGASYTIHRKAPPSIKSIMTLV